MFLHFGENNLIKLKDIIGVFDIETLKNSSENKQFLDNIKEIDKNNKTLIIGKNENYFSNISVTTINKRINQKMMF
ncbi:MAG: DUF370 domain-containing protein [Clostridia bacterium]|nr:DUF370 domain-containing protein [Clostridia bacterium]